MALLTPEQVDGRTIVQAAFVVDDVERAAHYWAETFGAGPFFLYDKVPLLDVRDATGAPAVLEQAAAFGQWGHVMVELVQPQRADPGLLTETMTRPGPNHIAYFAADTAAEVKRLEASGAPVIASLDFGGVRVHFHDARATAGFVIEHYPCIDAVKATYEAVAQAAEGWDGSDPVRGPLG